MIDAPRGVVCYSLLLLCVVTVIADLQLRCDLRLLEYAARKTLIPAPTLPSTQCNCAHVRACSSSLLHSLRQLRREYTPLKHPDLLLNTDAYSPSKLSSATICLRGERVLKLA